MPFSAYYGLILPYFCFLLLWLMFLFSFFLRHFSVLYSRFTERYLDSFLIFYSLIQFSLQRDAFLVVVTYPSVTSLKFHHFVWKTYLLSSLSPSLAYNSLKFFCINAWTATLHFVQRHYLESSRIYSPLVFHVYFYFFCPRVPSFLLCFKDSLGYYLRLVCWPQVLLFSFPSSVLF